MRYSFGLLKPDCLQRGIEKKVLSEIESAGLKIIASKCVRLTQENVAALYECHIGKPFYEDLLAFCLSGNCMVFIVEGNDAINVLKNIVGYQAPKEAKKTTIRHKFGQSLRRNVIHDTSDENTFWTEALLFFTQLELNQLLTNLE